MKSFFLEINTCLWRRLVHSREDPSSDGLSEDLCTPGHRISVFGYADAALGSRFYLRLGVLQLRFAIVRIFILTLFSDTISLASIAIELQVSVT